MKKKNDSKIQKEKDTKIQKGKGPKNPVKTSC